MKSFWFRSPSSSRCLISRLAALFLVMQTAHAAIDGTATQQIWKLKYGVTDAQIADANWLAADADGDGISNGNEMIAGTNPFNSAKTIKVSSVAKNGSNVDLQFPTEPGKLYQAQSSTTLGSSAVWTLQPVGAPVQVLGNGATATLSVP